MLWTVTEDMPVELKNNPTSKRWLSNNDYSRYIKVKNIGSGRLNKLRRDFPLACLIGFAGSLQDKLAIGSWWQQLTTDQKRSTRESCSRVFRRPTMSTELEFSSTSLMLYEEQHIIPSVLNNVGIAEKAKELTLSYQMITSEKAVKRVKATDPARTPRQMRNHHVKQAEASMLDHKLWLDNITTPAPSCPAIYGSILAFGHNTYSPQENEKERPKYLRPKPKSYVHVGKNIESTKHALAWLDQVPEDKRNSNDAALWLHEQRDKQFTLRQRRIEALPANEPLRPNRSVQIEVYGPEDGFRPKIRGEKKRRIAERAALAATQAPPQEDTTTAANDQVEW